MRHLGQTGGELFIRGRRVELDQSREFLILSTDLLHGSDDGLCNVLGDGAVWDIGAGGDTHKGGPGVFETCCKDFGVG